MAPTSDGASDDRAAFVRANTRLRRAPFVPEIRLHLADEALTLWDVTYALPDGRRGVRGLGDGPPLPFWAFVWAGGQALARYILDRPETVAGLRVLDLGSGSGLVAIAAAMAGAASVTACDVDPLAIAACQINASVNGVDINIVLADLLDGDGEGADVVIAADLFYEQRLAERTIACLDRARRRGAAEVLVGDLGRTYLPRDRLEAVATYDVPCMPGLEDAEVKRTSVWCLI
jgi:predicted nicotinamide N-methyase